MGRSHIGEAFGGTEEIAMGKRSKTGVLKRLREVKKAEKAAMKRDIVKERRESETTGSDEMVATDDDLAGYGFPADEEVDEEEEEVV
jgi:hypothetical protein